MEKQWWTSKTLWANSLALVALIAQGQFGFVISPEIQAAALTIINFILRFATKGPVTK